ncbi:hypothetical protein [Luteolibacter sp. AS25]|uniref:hypothetical protein n=1 Tax=Luteolibacter sp. AS25 TaxID=3135776 RepID=UPI00398AE6DF
MDLPDRSIDTLRPLTDAELEEWEEAYAAVEAYLRALRIRNKLLTAELVRRILWRSSSRLAAEPTMSPRELAIEETLREIGAWTSKVLGEELEDGSLAAQGRLALLLAGMPDKWQGVFLTSAPWPDEFVESMRSSYLKAGPNFSEMTMVPKPLELNVLGAGAAQWWETMERRPILREMAGILFFTIVGILIWFIFWQ